MKRDLVRAEGCAVAAKKGCCGSGLEQLFDSLVQAFAGAAAFDQVDAVFRAAIARVPGEEWQRFAHYSTHGYSRNLLVAQESFSLLLLCWGPGQMTPLHAHARAGETGPGRASWGHVLEGDLLLVHYADGEGRNGERQIVGSPTLFNSANPCLREPSPRGFHVLQNINATRRATSVHLYSPPLLECCWEDKLRNLHSVPVSYTPIGPNAIQSPFRFMTVNHTFFTSFEALAGIVTAELKRGKDIDRMTRIFESLRFNPKEFQRYAHYQKNRYTRNLVGYNSGFTLLMLCWDRGQESPIHDHAGSSCFMKILEGELHEVRYDIAPGSSSKLKLKNITRMCEEDVAYIDDTQGVHKMVNPSMEQACVSLHIYVPPYTKCSIFNLAAGTAKMVDMSVANAYNDKPFTPLQLDTTGDCSPITTVPDLIGSLRSAFGSTSAANLTERRKLVRNTLDRVHFIQSEWAEVVHFSDFDYQRILLENNDEFSLLLISWNASQKAPLHTHNHAPENLMYVKTVLGSVVLRRYADESGSQIVSEQLLDPENHALVMSNKELGWHVTANASSQYCALSLHLFTPPMLECIHSSGVAPVVYCEKLRNNGILSSSASTACMQSDANSAAAAASLSLSPLKPSLARVQACATVFSNFQMLLELLWDLFEKETNLEVASLQARLTEILQKIEFNPKEVEQYKSLNGEPYVRRRVALHPSFEIFIVSWRAGTQSPIHDHGGSSAMFKVLEGTVLDEHFSKPQRGMPPYVVESDELHRNDVAFHHPGVIHRMTVRDQDCCGMALYLPAYDSFCTYCPKTGECSSVFFDEQNRI